MDVGGTLREMKRRATTKKGNFTAKTISLLISSMTEDEYVKNISSKQLIIQSQLNDLTRLSLSNSFTNIFSEHQIFPTLQYHDMHITDTYVYLFLHSCIIFICLCNADALYIFTYPIQCVHTPPTYLCLIHLPSIYIQNFSFFF